MPEMALCGDLFGSMSPTRAPRATTAHPRFNKNTGGVCKTTRYQGHLTAIKGILSQIKRTKESIIVPIQRIHARLSDLHKKS